MRSDFTTALAPGVDLHVQRMPAEVDEADAEDCVSRRYCAWLSHIGHCPSVPIIVFGYYQMSEVLRSAWKMTCESAVEAMTSHWMQTPRPGAARIIGDIAQVRIADIMRGVPEEA